MKHLVFGLLITATTFSLAQDADSTVRKKDPVEPHWVLKSICGTNGTQASFVNWNAGGRNNISLLGYISATGNYVHESYNWDNNLDIALGGVQYIGKDSDGTGLQKTDDRIEVSSKFGYKIKKNKKLYTSVIGGFKTQFLDGFQHPNDSVRVSTFMAPGYLSIALGMDYKPSKHFSVFLSPAASKTTFVRDQALANDGAFGVTPGEQFRHEIGAYFKMMYNNEIAKNIRMITRLDLFSNYLENPENIDVNLDVLFNFKVNSWFSASANFTLLYDHDILITDSNGNTGPRTQFKSVLGMGVSYTMKNFEDKKEAK